MAVKNAPAPQRQRVSMKLENFSAGGVLPEGDYLVAESSFVLFTYESKDGNKGATTTAHKMILQPVVGGKPDANQSHDQIWSVGSPENFVPSEDGNFLECSGTATSLSKQSNFFLSYEALVNAGLPEDKWDDEGAGLLVGMIGHIAHIPAPERNIQRSAVGSGVTASQPQQQRNFPKTVPIFKTIISSPWDKGKAKSAVKSSPKATAKQPEPEPEAQDVGSNERLAGFLKDAIASAGGKVSKTKARLECHRAYNKSKVDVSERDAELAVFNDDVEFESLLDSINCLLNGSDIESAS